MWPPEQGEWNEATLKELFASAERQRRVWIESLGKAPPMTCEEYENM
jgi:hypothetical protein